MKDNDKKTLLEASCRLAFAAYMHDVGKLAQRANLEADKEKLEIHKQQYCPRWDDRFTHWHAAYSVLSVDRLEPYLPDLVRASAYPFESHHELSPKTDSLINAIGMHHRPETYLQWIVATADRASSGFERANYEEYNRASDSPNFKRERLLNIFEQIEISENSDRKLNQKAFKTRIPLRFFSPDSLMPISASQAEPTTDKAAEQEYRKLWDMLEAGLKQIPEQHRANWPLWLEHFDSLWMMVSHAIPSATSKYSGVRPDVSLYDHSRTTAAFATAIWRYHEEYQHDKDFVTKCLQSRTGEHGWDEKKLLLIQGDFFGIQNFIFASGGETQKQAAKLLRGRSFYVSLLTELAALKLLEALALPPTSMVLNAAGKFLVVAPNTPSVRDSVASVQNMLDQWFLEQTYGEQGIGLATVQASCNQFVVKDAKAEGGFRQLMHSLFTALEKKKLARFDLLKRDKDFAVRSKFLTDFNSDEGVCKLTGRLPAHKNGKSKLAADQIEIGAELARSERNFIAICVDDVPGKRLTLPIFGYQIRMIDNDALSNAFAQFIASGVVRRLYDVTPPEPKTMWRGIARRFINAHAPRFTEIERQWETPKYKNIDDISVDDTRIKSFEHIACEDRQPIDSSLKEWKGITALGVLKGDVDNLGLIFQSGIRDLSFARMASLSRQLNNFFAVYLPWFCQNNYPNTYTVFAGGDDFFLIGPWYSQMKLAIDMRQEFSRFTANDQVTFSAALVNFKPGVPVRHFSEYAEEQLEAAKHANTDEKNRVSCFGQILRWDELKTQLDIADQIEEETQNNKEFSTGFVYGLIDLVRMAELAQFVVTANKWRAHLVYRIKRLLIDRNAKFKEDKNAAQKEAMRLRQTIGGEWIEKYKGKLLVALQTYLYLNRD